MTTGKRMRLRRKELGLSAEYVAEKLGCSAATVYRYENGDIEKMPIDILTPLSSILSTTPEFLMGWDDEKPLSVSAEGLSDIKKDLIDKIMAMDDETVAALNRIADQVLALRDK